MASAEEKGKTIWEMVKERFSKDGKQAPEGSLHPVQPQTTNTITAKHGDFVQFKTADLADKRFMVLEISNYRRTIGDKVIESIDYFLNDEESGQYVTLRANPRSGVTADDPHRTDYLVLYPDYEGEYDEALHKDILPKGVLEVRDDKGNITATYQRLYGKTDPDQLTVKVDPGDGKIANERYEFWDFGRDIANGKSEFYFVEMNLDTGVFQMFRGVPVAERDIVLTRK